MTKSFFYLCLSIITTTYAQSNGVGEAISEVGTLSSIASSIEELPGIPTQFKLYPNYPNPFNQTTKIKYSLIEPAYVTLKILDVNGREISKLINTEQTFGTYEITLNLKNLSSGIYLYELKAGRFKASNKMNFIK